MSEQQRVLVECDYSLPPSEVFSYLAEHENLARVFSCKVRRLSDGSDGTRNGVGSSRELKIGIMPGFVETTTEVVPNQLIRWRITKGSPLRNHQGAMHFTPNGTGTHLQVEITFAGAFPLVSSLVAGMMRKGLPDGLATVEAATR
ncbi:MAG: SRPBCC family protein [Candidatus Dormibacteria bacterium]